MVSVETTGDLFGHQRFKCSLCHVHGPARANDTAGNEMLRQDIADHENAWLHISLVKERRAS